MTIPIDRIQFTLNTIEFVFGPNDDRKRGKNYIDTCGKSCAFGSREKKIDYRFEQPRATKTLTY